MKSAIYVRVSTEEQKEGFSILAQIKLVTEYCEKNNISIHKIYTDEGISGQKEDRPEFQQMIKDAEKHLFDVILVHKFDRFARNVELSQKIKNRLKKAKINVISITEPIEDSPIGFFQEGLLELLSEYYVRNLSREVKKGMRGRAESGLALGAMPYGYDNERNIIPEQADIVRKIFEMYLDGWGVVKISKWLNDNRIPTYKKNTARWCYRIIQNVIRQEKYAGYFIYDKKEYQGKWTPIIPKEDFEKATNIRFDKFNNIPNYNTKHSEVFPLLGLLFCEKCGRRMQIHTNGTGKRKDSKYVYICGMAKRDKTMCNHNKNYKAIPFEGHVIEQIREIINKRKNLTIKETVNLKDVIEARKEKISKELDRAKKAYIAGVFDLCEYRELKEKLEFEISEVKAPEPNQQEVKNKLLNILEEYESEKEPNKKRMILKKIIQEIRVSPDNIEVILVP